MEYNLNGDQISYIVYKWDKNISDWIEFTLTERTYDESGNWLSMSNSEYNRQAGKWDYRDRRECTYNSLGFELQETIKIGDQSGDNWVNKEKTENEYIYDSMLTISIKHVWEVDSADWFKHEKLNIPATRTAMISTIQTITGAGKKTPG